MSASATKPKTGADAPTGRRDRWEARTSTPLMVLGVVFLFVYAVLVLDERTPHWLNVVLACLMIATWAAFLLDFVIRVLLTPKGRRVRFVFTRPLDLLSVFLPVFRALRVVNLLHNVAFFRGHSGEAFRARVVISALAYAVVFVFFIALATLHVERDAPGANITSFGDAIWWACVTVATVGYGDTYPVTGLGRCYGVLLMIGGIAIIGTASATVVSLFNDRLGRMRHEAETTGEMSTMARQPALDLDPLDVDSEIDDEIEEGLNRPQPGDLPPDGGDAPTR
ncbi:potassium channel family protein [Agromyces endophyticus]|uniref:potassium channel family protein n=1 Tax=Agromyces sp. H17E-10 TaxID=2932244 RepID=UPI001FD3D4F0|nr:potassium channel family protein [Agromyces sp. H17E-10]UOQ89744.1 potassium channel family protein [Agromyces sp. H17E-10]